MRGRASLLTISLSSRVSVDACERMRGRKRGGRRRRGRSVVIEERCIAALREEERERAKAMPHSATLATRLGAELKARILPQRGDAALAPHKSSCFCSEQGGENRRSPLSPPLPSSRAYQPDFAYFIYPACYSAKLPPSRTPSASRYHFHPLSVSRSNKERPPTQVSAISSGHPLGRTSQKSIFVGTVYV